MSLYVPNNFSSDHLLHEPPEDESMHDDPWEDRSYDDEE